MSPTPHQRPQRSPAHPPQRKSGSRRRSRRSSSQPTRRRSIHSNRAFGTSWARRSACSGLERVHVGRGDEAVWPHERLEHDPLAAGVGRGLVEDQPFAGDGILDRIP
jgi:hypothetical protein